jgi:hypothetical protein
LKRGKEGRKNARKRRRNVKKIMNEKKTGR